MDVVCMAFGFNESNKDLFDKVHEASGKMLIIAAPTNESNAGDIAYPAQYDADVICMFSTSGAITSSNKLNPSKGRGLHNFAILGEDIRTLSGEQRSGTSFSTAIAAGLVGRLVEFSRHGDCQEKVKNASMMRYKHGMTKVLSAMAIQDGKSGCLKPWQVLPGSLRHQLPFDECMFPTDSELKDARDYICALIKLSLADAWW